MVWKIFHLIIVKLICFFTVGKTVENVFKYRNFKICSTGTQYQKLRKQPNFHRADILGENLAIVEMNRRKVTYNKPRYVGITVLNLAKVSIHHATIKEPSTDPSPTSVIFLIRLKRDQYSVPPDILFKELMYEFHYGHMLRLFGETGIDAKTRLLFTDTDR